MQGLKYSPVFYFLLKSIYLQICQRDRLTYLLLVSIMKFFMNLSEGFVGDVGVYLCR